MYLDSQLLCPSLLWAEFAPPMSNIDLWCSLLSSAVEPYSLILLKGHSTSYSVLNIPLTSQLTSNKIVWSYESSHLLPFEFNYYHFPHHLLQCSPADLPSVALRYSYLGFIACTVDTPWNVILRNVPCYFRSLKPLLKYYLIRDTFPDQPI